MDALWKENCERNAFVKCLKLLQRTLPQVYNFYKFLEKSVKQLIYNTVTGLQPATILKNELHNWYFSSH